MKRGFAAAFMFLVGTFLIFQNSSGLQVMDDPVIPLPPNTVDNRALINAPQEMAIYQRDLVTHRQKIGVSIRRAFPTVSHIEVIVYADHRYVTDTPLIASGDPIGVYSGFIPQGGWYQVDVIQFDATNSRAVRSRLLQIGVGDVYIVAGQSNAADWSETITVAKSPTSVMFDPTTGVWQPLTDPQPLTDGLRGSVWPQAIDLIGAAAKVPVGIVNTAIGGTEIEQWQPGAFSDDGKPLFSRLLATSQALRGLTGYRMILWHQGEGNLGTDATYRAEFLSLVSSLDTQLGGEKSKWMVSLATFSPPDVTAADCGTPPQPPGGAALRAVQQALPDDIQIFHGPDGDDLNGAGYRYPGSSAGMCIHWSTNGQTAMAKRWAEAIAALPN